MSWNSRNSLPTNLQGNSVGRRDRTSHITQSFISTGRSKSHDREAQYHNTSKRKHSDRIQTRINASFCLLFSISPMRRQRKNRLCFDVRKSVHHHTIQINQPPRCNSFTSLLLDVYVSLNVFRALFHPSLGAYNCTRSLWFYRWRVADGALLVVVCQTKQ